ncbi:MAG: MFS transporter [Akkermansiaceae bacterium]|nr:MFS transporter [Akkermansiaceae bacterium]MCP5545668.1 MFS transporter [Akkermansiaceae bacterium]MCP5548893.1 MFS transporter [Akkermansiaceae bacterium]
MLTMEDETKQRLGWTERIGYGLGDLASNLYFQMFNMFLLYYYTDVFGIPAATVATIFLLSRVWDAVNDPVMGIIADRTRTRWGSFRPFILWFAIPFGVGGYAMFYSPDLSATMKVVYAAVTYTIVGMLYTAVNIPYSGLMAVISHSSDERARVSAIRFIFAFLGGWVIAQFLPPLKDSLGGGDEVVGFRHTMGLFAGLAAVLFLVTFATTRERVAPESGKTSRKQLGRDIATLVRTRPWLVLVVAGLVNLTAVAIKNGSNIYYFKYITGDDSEVASFGSGGWMAMIAGVMCTGFFIRFFEKRKLIIWLTILGGIGMALPFWIDPAARISMPGLETGPYQVFGLKMTSVVFIPENPRWIYLVNLAGSFLAGPPVALVWTMYTDVAAYIRWKHDRRITGLVVSAAVFSQKFGMAFGGWFAGMLLFWCGFQANMEQNETSKLAILLLFSLIPAVLIVLQGAAMFFYPLTDAEMRRIERQLAGEPDT